MPKFPRLGRRRWTRRRVAGAIAPPSTPPNRKDLHFRTLQPPGFPFPAPSHQSRGGAAAQTPRSLQATWRRRRSSSSSRRRRRVWERCLFRPTSSRLLLRCFRLIRNISVLPPPPPLQSERLLSITSPCEMMLRLSLRAGSSPIMQMIRVVPYFQISAVPQLIAHFLPLSLFHLLAQGRGLVLLPHNNPEATPS